MGRAGRHAVSVEARKRRWLLGALPIALLAVACISVAATIVPPPAPGTPVLMLTGDSVPLHLESAFEREAAERGWRVVSTAFGSCPVTGEIVANRAGEPVHRATGCDTTIVEAQTETIRTADPDVVIWWDRWSISSFLTAGGEYVRSGTARYWQLRRSTLEDAVHRLTLGGAIVVFVATEPPGRAILDRCRNERCDEWTQFQVDHYDDVTVPWNATLRLYARQHPDQAVFVSITDVVCRTDEAPCDDSIAGIPARPDGTHYGPEGEKIVLSALAARIAPLLEHDRA